jgi:exodeoxyribonuclease VII small subunit
MNVEELLKSSDINKALEKLTFEEGLKLLEELVVTVESGKLPLESSVNSYEKGAKLIEKLRKQLQGAEARLKVLDKK